MPLHYLEVVVLLDASSSVCGCSFGFGFCGLFSPGSLKTGNGWEIVCIDTESSDTRLWWFRLNHCSHLKAWMMTVPKRMKRAEKIKDKMGIISRLQETKQFIWTNCTSITAMLQSLPHTVGSLIQIQLLIHFQNSSKSTSPRVPLFLGVLSYQFE